MPAFKEVVLGRFCDVNVFCCKCGRKLGIRERVWRHSGRCGTRYYCESCYKALWC